MISPHCVIITSSSNTFLCDSELLRLTDTGSQTMGALSAVFAASPNLMQRQRFGSVRRPLITKCGQHTEKESGEKSEVGSVCAPN